MARKGDGIYKRGSVWWLDAIIKGTRYSGRSGRESTARWRWNWRASSGKDPPG